MSSVDELEALRQTGGYSKLGCLGVVEIRGRDAARFLQFRTTNDVMALMPGQGQLNALLDRTGHLQALFTLHRLGDQFLAVLPGNNIKSFIEHMERYHMREDLQIADRTKDYEFIAVQGLLSKKLVQALSADALPVNFDHYAIAQLKEALAVNLSLTGDSGYLLVVRKEAASDYFARLAEAADRLGFATLSKQALNCARIEAGWPLWGIDISEEYLLTDTGFEQDAVSYTKGCYLGQEVVARIKTYGAPRKGLVNLLVETLSGDSTSLEGPLSVNGQEVGQITSSAFSPAFNRTVAFAYLQRDFRVPGRKLELKIRGQECSAAVSMLPLRRRRSDREIAQEIYDCALAEFSSGDETKAIALLRDALEIDPGFADCYESLGVMLSRRDQLEEAIELMKTLSKIDPASVMAHTNLSIFHMQQGNKEAAEEEKALAMSLEMQKIAREVKSAQEEEAGKAHKHQEARERMEMFRQVLDIDPDDHLANYGLGNLHVEVEEYQQAIPFLQKAISQKPNHSVAYLSLGTAYVATGNIALARETFNKGIAVAGQRGDMEPLKKMQQELHKLD